VQLKEIAEHEQQLHDELLAEQNQREELRVELRVSRTRSSEMRHAEEAEEEASAKKKKRHSMCCAMT